MLEHSLIRTHADSRARSVAAVQTYAHTPPTQVFTFDHQLLEDQEHSLWVSQLSAVDFATRLLDCNQCVEGNQDTTCPRKNLNRSRHESNRLILFAPNRFRITLGDKSVRMANFD